jgi:hypothetical protein
VAEPIDPAHDSDVTRATAQLPGLEIEIVHRLSPNRDAEQISINLQAVPSFEAFGRWVEAMNPFVVWMQTAQLFWSPWLGLANAGLFPGAGHIPRRGAAPRDEGP